MTVSLSAHFDGTSIVLDEEYPLRPQARLIVTVIENGGAEDAQGERRSWSVLSKHAIPRVFGDDEPCCRLRRHKLAFEGMSAQQIIEAIKALPPEQRADVVRFTRRYETVPQLAPEKLGELADRLASATDPAEIAQLEKAIINGFYGAKIDA